MSRCTIYGMSQHLFFPVVTQMYALCYLHHGREDRRDLPASVGRDLMRLLRCSFLFPTVAGIVPRLLPDLSQYTQLPWIHKAHA